MSAAIQCLSASLPLTRYFLSELYARELNPKNPLGMQGKLAVQYAKLLKALYTARAFDAVAPRNFKATIGKFRPQFNGNQQQDAQELLSFVLDGLHEDMNRIKEKPYVNAADSDNRSDAVVAGEFWGNHLKRHQSVIVDLFTGLLKSTLKFECGRTSVTFDPYTSLSLPLPKQKNRYLEVTVVYNLSSRVPTRYSIELSLNSRISDLKHALSALCGVPASRLQIADIYKSTIFSFLVSYNSCSDVRSNDELYAYETPPKKSLNKAEDKPAPPVEVVKPAPPPPVEEFIRVGHRCDVLDSVKKWLAAEVVAIRIQKKSPAAAALSTPAKAKYESTARSNSPTQSALDENDINGVRFVEEDSEHNNTGAENHVNSTANSAKLADDGPIALSIHPDQTNASPSNKPAVASNKAVDLLQPLEPTTAAAFPSANKGQSVDADDAKWEEVIQVPSVLSPDTLVQLKVHYEGWSSKWDEFIDQGSDRLAPAGSKALTANFKRRVFRHRNEELDIDGDLICIHAVHRKIESIENYFLHKAAAGIFGVPILLYVNLHTTTYADLYKLVWEKCRRFTAAFTEETFLLQPFTLKYVNRNGTACSKCNWLQLCLGCEISAGNNLLGSADWSNDIQVGIDWNPQFLEKYFNFQDLNDIWLDPSVQANRAQFNSALSVADCMAMFTAPEKLEKDAAVYCSKCKKHETAMKTLELWNTPNILVVHLKRLTAQGKLYTLVDCPLQGFDPFPFLAIPDVHLTHSAQNAGNQNNNLNVNTSANIASKTSSETPTASEDDGLGLGLDINSVVPTLQSTPSKKVENHNNGTEKSSSEADFSILPPATPTADKSAASTQGNGKYTDRESKAENNNNIAVGSGAAQNHNLYDLFATVNHLGSSGGGHYTANCKQKQSNRWYKFDDNWVSEIDSGQVITGATYMLFYEKRRGNSKNGGGKLADFDFLPVDVRKKLMGELNDEQKANLKELEENIHNVNPCCAVQ
jgi:ubiquitin C-terminal hydrolase